MRTDVSKRVSESEQHKFKTVENVETMKTRKTLHPLQEAAGDKENLVGSGRMPPSGKVAEKSTRKVATPSSSSKIEKKKHTVVSKAEKKITPEDLTSQAGPSEHYWEVLAERRRVALDKALKENEKLHEHIAALEAENEHCKILLEESKTLIDTLSEVLNANESDQSVNESSFVSDQSVNESSFVSDQSEDTLLRPRDE